MNTPATAHARRVARGTLASGLAVASFLVSVACQDQPSRTDRAPNPALRDIQAPPGATQSDADRAALARFVGTWRYEGWSTGTDGTRKAATGSAAGTIEREHFVLLDLQAAEGQQPVRSVRKSGSMLLASEPGLGITLTAWGDASPSVSRFTGWAEGEGSTFTFREARTPSGRARLGATLTFESDDRWVAVIRNASVSGEPIVASYTFTRTQ